MYNVPVLVITTSAHPLHVSLYNVASVDRFYLSISNKFIDLSSGSTGEKISPVLDVLLIRLKTWKTKCLANDDEIARIWY